MNLKPHKFAAFLPNMTEAEFAALKADIADNGQRESIVLYQGKILDGRYRCRALKELKRKPRTITFKGTDNDAISLVYSSAVRRNMNDSQKAVAAFRFLPYFEKAAISRLKLNGKAPVPDLEKGQSRDFAGRAFGVSGRYVADAKFVFERDPTLLQRVFDGELPLTRAKRMVNSNHRSKQLIAKAKLAPPVGNCRIIHGKCLDEMEKMPGKSFRLIFADPPYNIGVDYGGARSDRMAREEYLAHAKAWMEECHRLLTDDGTLWVVISDEFAGPYQCILETLFHRRAWIKWYETFGHNCTNNFNRTSRHLFYCVKDRANFIFNTDPFKRKSDRQTKYNDPRALPGGKLWDDVWTHIPRLVENAKERVTDFPNQLPLALVEPIVLGCSEPGDAVFDPFVGSGTTAVAAVTNGRSFTGTEANTKNAKMAHTRVQAAASERKQANEPD